MAGDIDDTDPNVGDGPTLAEQQWQDSREATAGDDVPSDGPTLEEARTAAAVIAPEPDEDTDDLPVDVADGEAGGAE